MAEGQDLSLQALRVTVFQESVIEIDLTPATTDYHQNGGGSHHIDRRKGTVISVIAPRSRDVF